MPDQPTGWFIIKSSRNRDFTQNAPCHVLVEYLNIPSLEDDELDNILKFGEVTRINEELLADTEAEGFNNDQEGLTERQDTYRMEEPRRAVRRKIDPYLPYNPKTN